MGVNALHKFGLLMWKNWLLEIRHKWSLFFEITLPLLFCGLVLAIRSGIEARIIDRPTFFKPFEPTPIKYYDIVFAPDEYLTRKIMISTFEKLHLPYVPIGFKDKDEMEKNLTDNSKTVGIVFYSNFGSNQTFPKDLKFSIRFPSEQDYRVLPTDKLMPDIEQTRPREVYSDEGGFPFYESEGFLALQNFVSQSYIELANGKKNFQNSEVPKIQMQRFPYPPYIEDTFVDVMSDSLPFFIILCFLSPFSVMVKQITSEKEHQLKEVMKMMGLDNWLHWLAWFVKSMIFFIIISAIAVMMFKIPLNNKTGVMVLKYADGSAVFFVLCIYSIAVTTFGIMAAVFFSKANTAQSVSTILFFITFIPFYRISEASLYTSMGPKLGSCLLFNTAIGLSLRSIMKLEGSGIGLQWNNMFASVSLDDGLSIGILLIMMLIDSLIYILIGLYVEKIFPGEYGVPEPWYFPFTKNFWCGHFVGDIGDNLGVGQMKNAKNFESGPDDKLPGIRIRGLRKVYGRHKIAVSGLSMDMYEDHITALLGHNGAGKTTTMSMLTGLFPPTAGTAIINGSDIRYNIKGVRTSLGLCPQKNIIFNDLTVGEHLKFYCSLKGLNKSQTKAEIRKYLGILDLSNKTNSLSSQLSGGMKRKLCVAIALCGYSKVVLLDEPTSGMDPAARRNLWNLLQQDKKGRTILLSTHFMDEADILGDRIAILSHGDLKACGSSFFLKKRFGVGYHLICEKGIRCNSYNITKLLQKHIPKIAVESNVGSELSYQLPEESVSIFERMLKDLEDNSEALHLSGYGISPTTLEEVFMRVEAEMISDSKQDSSDGNNELPDTEALTLYDYQMDTATLLKGPRLHGAQWVAMFTKKFYYTIRNWLMLSIHVLIPVAILVGSVLSMRSEFELKEQPPLKITLASYEESTNIFVKNNTINGTEVAAPFQDNYINMFKTFNPNWKLNVINEDFEDYILDLGKTMQSTINRKYLIATSVNSSYITAWFNGQLYHTPPLSLNLVYNALAKTLLGKDHNIEVTNEPFPHTKDYIKKQLEKTSSVGFILSFNLGLAMCFVGTFFVLFAIKERVSKAKLLQFVSGINISTFWITSFLWDFVFFLGIVTIITITFAILQVDGYSSIDELGRVYLVLLLFAYSSIPLTYILSLLFQDAATGYGRISVIYLLLGPALFLVVFILDFAVFKGEGTLGWYFRIIPHYSMCDAISKMYTISTQCSVFDCKHYNYFSMDNDGIGPDIIFLAFGGLFYMIILLLIEYGVFNEFVYKLIRMVSRRTLPFPDQDMDDDVSAEKNLLQNMSMTEIKSKNLVLRNVSKFYKNFLAVNQLSIAIQKGECFGLIGINGAGKTTTFKMLTGDENISSGDIYVQGIDLKTDMTTVYKHIGYCPQFDALIEDLTGRETIKIYCLLRGVRYSKINAIVRDLAKSLGFCEYIDQKVREYSGGTKRKLSTALALVGGPDIIYLDEPTTGMDPKSRRQLWDVICKIRDSGRTIVLTSHSMEECEALCTRLAIMVNGEFKCIGSRQHLKNKFSKGLVLVIQMKRLDEGVNANNSHENGYESVFGDMISKKPSKQFIMKRIYPDGPAVSDFTLAVSKVKEFVSTHFSEAILKDEYKELLTFFIPKTSIRWSHIFGLMQANKMVLNIEDYSISQTTLEQIFLDFAKNQRTIN